MAERRKAVRLPGHELMFEGAAYGPDGSRLHWNTVAGYGYAKCGCGSMSPEALASAAARKRWHRAHKDAVLAHQETEEAAR